MARTAKRWGISPREAASIVDGEEIELDELAELLPEIEACDALEIIAEGMKRYDADKTKGKQVPFPRDTLKWFEGLKREAAGGDAPGAGFEDEWDAVDAREVEGG